MRFWAKWFRSPVTGPNASFQDSFISTYDLDRRYAEGYAIRGEYEKARAQYERMTDSLNREMADYRMMTRDYVVHAVCPNRETYRALVEELCGAVEAEAHLKLLGGSKESELFRSAHMRARSARAALIAAVYEPEISEEEFERRKEEFLGLIARGGPS